MTQNFKEKTKKVSHRQDCVGVLKNFRDLVILNEDQILTHRLGFLDHKLPLNPSF